MDTHQYADAVCLGVICRIDMHLHTQKRPLHLFIQCFICVCAGQIYSLKMVPSASTLCVVNIKQTEAKIEALLSDYVQLQPASWSDAIQVLHTSCPQLNTFHTAPLHYCTSYTATWFCRNFVLLATCRHCCNPCMTLALQCCSHTPCIHQNAPHKVTGSACI